MSSAVTHWHLLCQNLKFRGTGGRSQANRGAGFTPAFLDEETGRTEPSRLPGGVPAPIHLLCGLPDEWVVTRDASGGVVAVKASIVAGFLRGGRFYSREEAALACQP